MKSMEIMITEELNKYKNDIEKIQFNKKIDCITVFSKSVEEYEYFNKVLCENRIVDNMASGNLYYLKNL